MRSKLHLRHILSKVIFLYEVFSRHIIWMYVKISRIERIFYEIHQIIAIVVGFYFAWFLWCKGG